MISNELGRFTYSCSFACPQSYILFISGCDKRCDKRGGREVERVFVCMSVYESVSVDGRVG